MKKMISIICMLFFLAIQNNIIAQLPASWESKGIGGGGSMFSPSISPHDSNNVFISCDMTEVFQTTNQGDTWDIVDFRELQSFPNTKVQFTSNSNILYAIHFNFEQDIYEPYTSNDGGETWNILLNDPTFGSSLFLYANPNSTQELLLADWLNIYFSNDGGNTWSTIYTINAGNIFLAGVFWDENNIYAGTNEGLLTSTNGGNSFSLSTNGLPSNSGFSSLAGAKQNGISRLYGIVYETSDLYPDMLPYIANDSWACKGIYTLDVGENWTPVHNVSTSDPQKYFYIACAENDISIAYAGGKDFDTYSPIIYKTSNGGSTWDHALTTFNNENINTGWCGHQGDREWGYSEVTFGLAVDPNNADMVLFTDYGFVHMSTNGGNNWQQKYMQSASQNPMGAATPKGNSYFGNGMENTSCWWLTWTSENNLFASFTDIKGIRSTDQGESWSFDYSGYSNNENSTYHILKHPAENIFYASVSTVHDLYQSTYLHDNQIDEGDGELKYSNDECITWQTLHDFNHPVLWTSIDPNNHDIMYASVAHSTEGGIYKTSNLSDGTSSVWIKVTDPPRTEGHPLTVEVLNDGSVVCSYSGRRNASWAFTESSGVFISTNGGTSWTDVSDEGMHFWTKDLIIDLHDATQNTWFTCVHSGWGGAPNNKGGIYKTTDRGENWIRITDSDRVESMTIHPTNPNIAFFTTEYEGLWHTDNLTSPIPSFSQVQEYSFQHPMRVFFNPYDVTKIWVTSFGNGLKLGNISTSPVENIKINKMKVKIYPNPTNNILHIDTEKNEAISVKISTLTGKVLFMQGGESGSLDIVLDHLPKGIYMLNGENESGHRFSQKVVVQ